MNDRHITDEKITQHAADRELAERQKAYYQAVADKTRGSDTPTLSDQEMLKLVLRRSGQKRVLTLSDAVGKFNKVQKRRAKNKSARSSRKRNR